MTKRILLCDDELHILRAAEFKFKRAGYEVVCANDGQEGWEQIEQQRPDIVVTDCQMPRLSGLGLAERIRQTPATADLPVIMLSAKGFELSPRRAADAIRHSLPDGQAVQPARAVCPRRGGAGGRTRCHSPLRRRR